jgi:hypothetical protein
VHSFLPPPISCGIADSPDLAPVRAPDRPWFETGEVDPNPSEVLFFALLLVATAESRATLRSWAKQVVDVKPEAMQLKASWQPPQGEGGWPLKNKVSTIFGPLDAAYNRTAWSDSYLDQIGAAMQLFDGDGRIDNVRMSGLRNHLRKGKPPRGVRAPGKKGDAPPRWRTCRRRRSSP